MRLAQSCGTLLRRTSQLIAILAICTSTLGEAGQLVCQRGQRACVGPFGATCYAPSSGAVCSGGMVCGQGQQICAGPFGAMCYSPSSGQRCQLGLICGQGQQVCGSGGFARCYTPSAGETCN